MTTTADTLQHLKSLLAMIDETVVKAKSNTSALYTQHLPDLSTAITTALLSNDQDVINNLTKVDKSIASGEVMAGGEDLAKVKSAIVALNGKVKVKDDKSVPLAAADIRAFFPNLDAFGIAKKNRPLRGRFVKVEGSSRRSARGRPQLKHAALRAAEFAYLCKFARPQGRNGDKTSIVIITIIISLITATTLATSSTTTTTTPITIAIKRVFPLPSMLILSPVDMSVL